MWLSMYALVAAYGRAMYNRWLRLAQWLLRVAELALVAGVAEMTLVAAVAEMALVAAVAEMVLMLRWLSWPGCCGG